jgi:glycosyltransferase involved in cell wall biosynthesis
MNLVIVSTFWNSEKYVSECINSLKNQYYTNFKAYFIDDMSTDSSYEVAKQAINGDNRFVLIKNSEKKFKCKNFVDVIRNNPTIKWNDVIVEIDGDDQLYDNHVLGLINKVYMNDDVWICGSRWVDKDGRSMNYGKANADNPRKTTWNFSHLRTYRAFLFRLIQDEHLKYEGEYFKAGVDIGIGLPMLEMSGNEHYYFLDEVTYLYNWHENQSYSEKGAIKDSKLQRRTASYIYSLPKYDKVVILSDNDDSQVISELSEEPKSIDLLNRALGSINDRPFNPNRITTNINYEKINEVINKETPKPVKEIIVNQNLPNNRNQIQQLRKESIASQVRKMKFEKPNSKNQTPNVFGGKRGR